MTAPTAFLHSFAAYAGWRFGLALALLVLLGLTQGAGLVLLLPLLQLLGIGAQAGGGPALYTHLADGLAALGLTLNLGLILALYVLIVSVHAGLRYGHERLSAALVHGYTSHLRRRLQAGISGAEWLYLVRSRGAHLSSALTVEIDRIGQGTTFFLRLLSASVLAAIHIGLALWLSPMLTCLSLAVAGALLLVLRPLNRRAQNAGQRLQAAHKGLYSEVGEQLGALKLVKGMGAEAAHIAGFAASAERVAEEMRDHAAITATTRLWFQLGAMLTLVGLCYTAVAVLALPAAPLLVLVAVFARLLPQLSQLQQSYQKVLHTLPAFSALEQLQAETAAAREPDGGAPALVLARAIEVRDVSFRYPAESGAPGPWALQDITIQIPAHSITALTGPSGAGKSTLADLLLGLLAPTCGEILVDGTPLAGAERAAWRRACAYVPQQTQLFHASIGDNLRWACPEADDDDLWAALRAAALQDYVRALPDALETVVGDRGALLSGGQAQRLSLARALLRQPRLLVLDEATSALDAHNEEHISGVLAGLRAHTTVVFIAHRSAALAAADYCIALEHGRMQDATLANASAPQ